MIDECLVVEFGVSGDDCPLADATRAVPLAIEAQPPQLRADGYALLRFSAPDDDRLATHLDADDRISYLHRARARGPEGSVRANYRCLSRHPCVVHELVSVGFLCESITYRGGGASLRGAVVGREVLEGVMSRAGETVGVTLRRLYPLGGAEDVPVAGRWNITPRQEEALRTALDMGYFAIPRAADAGDVARAMGLSKSAFLERLRRAERNLVAQLFEA